MWSLFRRFTFNDLAMVVLNRELLLKMSAPLSHRVTSTLYLEDSSTVFSKSLVDLRNGIPDLLELQTTHDI